MIELYRGRPKNTWATDTIEWKRLTQDKPATEWCGWAQGRPLSSGGKQMADNDDDDYAIKCLKIGSSSPMRIMGLFQGRSRSVSKGA